LASLTIVLERGCKIADDTRFVFYLDIPGFSVSGFFRFVRGIL
jgi:hypothetical protein